MTQSYYDECRFADNITLQVVPSKDSYFYELMNKSDFFFLCMYIKDIRHMHSLFKKQRKLFNGKVLDRDKLKIGRYSE